MIKLFQLGVQCVCKLNHSFSCSKDKQTRNLAHKIRELFLKTGISSVTAVKSSYFLELLYIIARSTLLVNNTLTKEELQNYRFRFHTMRCKTDCPSQPGTPQGSHPTTARLVSFSSQLLPRS